MKSPEKQAVFFFKILQSCYWVSTVQLKGRFIIYMSAGYFVMPRARELSAFDANIFAFVTE